ncbi:hypothetical protein J5N94_00130, partial [Pseudomonas aeruginosa]|nr:hypothetical protein [Pseudomonas aeruginosa]
TVVVGPGGSFEVPLNPPLTNGETVTVIVTDPAGNNSTPVTDEAPDNPAPPPDKDLNVAHHCSSDTAHAAPGDTCMSVACAGAVLSGASSVTGVLLLPAG